MLSNLRLLVVGNLFFSINSLWTWNFSFESSTILILRVSILPDWREDLLRVFAICSFFVYYFICKREYLYTVLFRTGYFEIRWMVDEYWKIKVEDKRKKKRARVEIITNDLSLFAPRNSSLDFRRRGNNSSVIRESNGVYQVSTRYLYFSITWLKRETLENQTFSIFSSKSF